MAIVCFALGAVVQRYYDLRSASPGNARTGTSGELSASPIDFANEPPWAYGFDTIRKAGEVAAPQAPPNRNLRTNEQTELYRNPRVGFVAYVPPGSIEKGRDLVTTGGMRVVGNTFIQGKTTACVTCHGLDLLGVTDVPPIAGRSPSYIVRQIWDIQQGTRNGAAVQLMKMAVARLTPQDLVSVAAYVSSRPVTRAAGAEGLLSRR